jgi:[acyl-carrier-protein] S-malonyltransferase
MTKFAFIFPGQGSQAIGMLNGFAGIEVVDQTLSEASDVLGFDMARLIKEGPKEDLDLTTNTQPVMLAAAIACYRAWGSLGGVLPCMVAGHSLGEYSALVAAGVVSFEDALRLVQFRAKVMQAAVPVGVGGMAAILGLADEDVRAVCQASAGSEVVEAVNFNAPMQVVIAGHLAALERSCALAKEKGAKRALMLPVSAPFHSSLLQKASDQLRDYLVDISFVSPRIPVINNIDVAFEEDPLLIKNALVRQASGPVRWVEEVKAMAARGVTHLVECGPGKVLTGLNKRIDSNLVALSLDDQSSLEKALELLRS